MRLPRERGRAPPGGAPGTRLGGGGWAGPGRASPPAPAGGLAAGLTEGRGGRAGSRRRRWRGGRGRAGPPEAGGAPGRGRAGAGGGSGRAAGRRHEPPAGGGRPVRGGGAQRRGASAQQVLESPRRGRAQGGLSLPCLRRPAGGLGLRLRPGGSSSSSGPRLPSAPRCRPASPGRRPGRLRGARRGGRLGCRAPRSPAGRQARVLCSAGGQAPSRPRALGRAAECRPGGLQEDRFAPAAAVFLLEGGVFAFVTLQMPACEQSPVAARSLAGQSCRGGAAGRSQSAEAPLH